MSVTARPVLGLNRIYVPEDTSRVKFHVVVIGDLPEKIHAIKLRV